MRGNLKMVHLLSKSPKSFLNWGQRRMEWKYFHFTPISCGW